MKKKVIEYIIITIIVISICCIFGRVGWWETHYSVIGTIVQVTEEEVLVVTEDGNLWAFDGKGFTEQDTVEMIMFTNGTDLNIYDDEIENIKKIA